MPPTGKLSETATTAPRGARRFVRDALEGLDTDTVERAELLASELTAAALLRSGTAAVRISVIVAGDAVHIVVHEPSSTTRRPADSRHAPDAADVVAALAARWGTEEDATGRSTWFELGREFAAH